MNHVTVSWVVQKLPPEPGLLQVYKGLGHQEVIRPCNTTMETWMRHGSVDAKTLWDVDEHPWKLIWRWKISIFNRKYIFKWWIFHCHISFWGGNIFCSPNTSIFLSTSAKRTMNKHIVFLMEIRALRPYGPIEIQQETSSLKTEIVKLPVSQGANNANIW